MKVSTHALFSHNHMIGSKIISKGSKHLDKTLPEISHVSLLVNERWVHEATGAGVKIYSYDKWSTVHTEVARVQLETREYQDIANQYRKIIDSNYDYAGVFFLGLCIIPTFIGLPLPKYNLWESKNKYFCCEVLGYMTNQYYGMCPPNMILHNMRNKYG